MQESITYNATRTASDYHLDNSRVRCLLGPVGSGKSVANCLEIVRRAAEQQPGSDGIRRTRWAIIRNTYPELKSTTIKTWQMWFPENAFGPIKWSSPITHFIKFDDIECEVIFIALDSAADIKKLMSLEVTGIYINELQFIPKSVFDICLQRINRYPSGMQGAPITWTGLISDTNPPDTEHWIYRLFEESRPQDYSMYKYEPALKVVKKIPENVLCRTSLDGTHYINNEDVDYNRCQNDPNYWLSLVPGYTDEQIKIYLMGYYGLFIDGRPVHPEYKDHVHFTAKNIIANKDVQIGLGWDFGLCYSDDTEVLTENGWKLFKDVDETIDLVATRNPANGVMEYTKINFKTEYDYDAELLEWDSQSVNFCVTPEHRVPFTYRDTPHKVHFQSAEWLASHMSAHHYVDLCSEWEPHFDDSIRYFGMTAFEYAEFMGLYLSEGCCDLNRISIYQNNQNPTMQLILNATGHNWVFNGSAWRCGIPELAAHLKTFGKACDKFVPSEIKGMPRNHIRAFIYSYTAGDGHIRQRKNGAIEHTLFTVSKRMANDFQELAQKAGWNSSLRIVKPQQSIIIEDGIERLIVNDGGYCITFKKRAKRAELLQNNFKRIPYKGKIYCLNVPYHVLYVRRNGKPSWNGNTPACAIVQLTPEGQFIVLDELFNDSMSLRDFTEVIVLPTLDRKYPFWRSNYVSRHDPAGQTGSQTDGKSCQQILEQLGINSEPAASSNSPTARRDGLKFFLRRMVMGEPSFLLTMNCKRLRKALGGGYQYERIRGVDERFHDKPKKDHYSHICEALEYIAMHYAAMPAESVNDNIDEMMRQIWFDNATYTVGEGMI